MKSFIRVLPFLAALAIAGCGGDSSDSGAGPLDNALGYLPQDAPLVISIDTDVEGGQFKAIGKILDRFPFANQVEGQLKQRLEASGGFDYEDDLKPMLGNEFVVGATDVRSIVNRGASEDFVGAIQVKDKGKLEDALDKEKAEEAGEKSGAKLYEDEDGDAFAVEDEVLVVASSKQKLEAALEQRDADDRLTEETFDKGTAGLPKDALLRVYGDLQKLIASDPDTADARKVKWVDALRTFGLAASFEDDQIDVGFKVGTDGGDLSEDDLPLASGDESPSVLDLPNEIGAGLRNPAQVFRFGEQAAQAVNPTDYADYRTAKTTLERRLDVDIDEDLIAQLEGALSVSVSTSGDVGARIDLDDEASFGRTLAKVEKELPAILSGAGDSPTRLIRRGDFRELASADGDRFFYGVVDGALVLSNDLARARRVAREEPEAVEGAKGALVVSADAEQLFLEALRSRGSIPGGGLGEALGGGLIAGPLGRLTGSASSSKDGITGNLRLTFD